MFRRFKNRIQHRAAPAPKTSERSSISLELRRLREGVVVGRASNDEVVDHYGTIITVEALHDWWEGYRQHRTLNLQHNMRELRGIRGKAAVGVGRRVDFTPQLEVEARVFDDETDRLIQERKIAGFSLEFLPTDERIEMRGEREVRVYYRLSSEPEHCSLSLVDLPGVPQSDIFEIRGLEPFWSYAVIDPKVLNGEVGDPELVARLMWVPHHDTQSRFTSQERLERAYAELKNITVPAEASLSREQIIQRAKEHLDRHQRLGLGVRASQKEEPVNKWIQLRMEQYQAEGLSEKEAKAKAKADFQKLGPEVRAKLEKAEGGEQPGGLAGVLLEAAEEGQRGITINVNGQQPQGVQGRAQSAQEAGEGEGEGERQNRQPEKRSKQERWLQARAELHVAEGMKLEAAQAQAKKDLEGLEPEVRTRLEGAPEGNEQGQLDRYIQGQVDARVQAMLAQPENPMAAIAGAGARARRNEDPDQLLSEIMVRTIVPQMQRRALDSGEVQKAYNMLRAHGISERALSIEANGTVIREELARQFVIKPAPDIIFRNHMRSMPMQGQKKVDFPRFSRQGLSAQWNRSSSVGAGSTAAITGSDPTLDTFPIEVTELNMASVVPDSFLEFNASGTVFVQQYLLPEMRGAAQYAEDGQFFLSSGSHPDPATFKGFKAATGVTAVSAGTNGDTFALDILSSLLRAMPVAFRGNISRLAFYVAVPIGDDYGDLLAARQTPLGDRSLERFANQPGPAPIGVHKGIPIYSAPQLPTDETQGTASNASTAYLVHRDTPVIGDALTLKMEPYRQEGFVTKLQLQEFVGLGYQFPASVVRRPGVLPAA